MQGFNVPNNMAAILRISLYNPLHLQLLLYNVRNKYIFIYNTWIWVYKYIYIYIYIKRYSYVTRETRNSCQNEPFKTNILILSAYTMFPLNFVYFLCILLYFHLYFKRSPVQSFSRHLVTGLYINECQLQLL